MPGHGSTVLANENSPGSCGDSENVRIQKSGKPRIRRRPNVNFRCCPAQRA